MMRGVVLAVLVVVAVGAPIESNENPIEALLQMHKNALHVNLDGHFYLAGWEGLALRECTDCPVGTTVQEKCTVTHDTICVNEEGIQVGYIKTSLGTFRAESEVDEKGRQWVMTHRWADTYPMNSDAFGDWDGEGDAKLSDEQINSISTSGNRVYKFVSPDIPKNLYIATDQPHDDMEKSFGSLAQHGLVGLDDDIDLDALDSAQSWTYGNNHGSFDGYSRGQGQACTRWFMGYNAKDCFNYTTGNRCMYAGSQCKSGQGHFRVPTKVYVLRR